MLLTGEADDGFLGGVAHLASFGFDNNFLENSRESKGRLVVIADCSAAVVTAAQRFADSEEEWHGDSECGLRHNAVVNVEACCPPCAEGLVATLLEGVPESARRLADLLALP